MEVQNKAQVKEIASCHLCTRPIVPPLGKYAAEID